jgi:uncharacterized membrane protein YdbT with pleckstrin-like domain
MALIACPDCNREVSDKAPVCPSCGCPVAASAKDAGEKTLLVDHPVLFEGNPIWPPVALLLSFVIVGIFIIMYAWMKRGATTLTITTRRTILETGLLSKQTTEVRHKDVRNIRVVQGVLNRLTNVGAITISSAGQADLELKGIHAPNEIADLIRRHQ